MKIQIWLSHSGQAGLPRNGTALSHLDKARYKAEYWFFENLVNMVNAENVVNVVNIIKAQEEEMICVSDI